MRRIIHIIFFFTYASICLNAQNGLFFKSHQVSKESRTSAYIDSKEGIRFRDYARLSFNYRFYDNASGCFGQICKLVIGEAQTLDMKLNVKYRGGQTVSFLLDGKTVAEWPKQTESDTVWNNVSFTIFPDDNSILIRNNSDTVSVRINALGKKRFKVYFGAEHQFSSRDVASFILGDVKIYTKPDKLKHFWKMDGYAAECSVSDVAGGMNMIVENPQWLMTSHMQWKKENSFEFPEFHMAVDGRNQVWVITGDAVYRYSLDSGRMDRKENIGLLDINQTSNHFFWNEEYSRLEYFFASDTSSRVSFYNEASSKWEPEIVPDNRWSMKGNVMYTGGDYVQMFGYGHHKYFSEIYVKRGDETDCLNGSRKISPRYLSAAGICGRKLFAVAGVGNVSGSQLAGSRIYTDIFSIDLDSGQILEIDGIDLPDKEVLVNNMLPAGDSLSFFALSYSPFQDSSYLKLRKIDLKNKRMESYSDSIAYKFNDITSDARICFSDSTGTLYAVTREDKGNGRYFLNVYSIKYPVISNPVKRSGAWMSFVPLVSIAVLAVCAVLAVFRYRRRKGGMEKAEPVTAGEKTVNNARSLVPGVYLLGGFRVINQNETDITGGFTPVMKQLLCLIILYTLKDDRGISNSMLKDYLWPDKSDESTINNRSVNLRKIRKLLSEVGVCEISSKNSYWHISLSDSFRCDMFEAKSVIDGFNSKKGHISQQDIADILKISSYGVLLPNQQNDFFDEFKSLYSSSIIDALNSCLEYTVDDALKLTVANAIFVFSPLDEFALHIKCKSLLSMGRSGLAKQTFETFAKDYREMMGEDFPYSFDYILNNIVS